MIPVLYSPPREAPPALVSRAAAALCTGLAAFLLYDATLVPGMDLGDSASFQVDAGSALITPRQGYPLYFALARVALRVLPGEPAHAINLMSAILGAVAVAVLTLFVIDVTGRTWAGAFGGLLFATSYTFWSQSVTAEVYALHVTCVGMTFIAFRRWAARPTSGRLAAAFAVYAASFGNHLSMILLAPAIVLVIGVSHPRRWRGLVDVRTVLLAVATAAAGASQYLWNVAGMLSMPDVPQGIDAVRAFWFDVTKTDWRASMVLATPRVMFTDRLAMSWFDVRQQFGALGVALALGGAVTLARRQRRDFLFLAAAFAANWLFAFTYNVGDVHVFFIPSHAVIAIAAACGAGAAGEWARSRHRHAVRMVAAAALIWVSWRAYDNFPALDRSADRRGEDVLDGLTRDLTADRAVLAADSNWQLQNGLSYYARYRKPDLQYFRSADRMLAFPFLVEDNRAIGRGMYLSEDAMRRVTAAFGALYAIGPDPDVGVTRLVDIAAALPSGTPYVLSVLTPYRDRPIDPATPSALLSILTGGASSVALPLDGYSVAIGVKELGATPILIRTSPSPFRAEANVKGLHILVRMDAWLAYDTIRRADFGHVIVNHRAALAIDRGLSFAAWPPDADPVVAYESSLYAVQPRYVLRPQPPE